MRIIDHRSLPEDRPTTFDDKGRRIYLFPAAVKGFWRNRRTLVQAILIAIFLIGPWIKLGGHQIILLDIPRRQFAFFGLTFWAHDTPILFFILLILAVSLMLVTAIWGRIWCGWACPQTVFIDGVFRRIERLVIGSHLQQMQFAKNPMSGEKLAKLTIKWSLFILISLVISHSFLAYFVGAANLWPMITSDPRENWTSFIVMGAVTGGILFDFAWFREQFCMIMCPYGRFQSLLMDRNSLAVIYDEKRGEPRGKKQIEKTGDCVDCFRCVTACPTGIDIRRGVQMECIACTACIDACNDVMSKVGRPKNLIRYESANGMEGRVRRIFTARVGAYITILLLGFAGLSWAIGRREPIDATVLRGNDFPYQIVTEGAEAGRIMNHFKLHIRNHRFEDVEISYRILTENVDLVAPINPVHLKPGELQRIPFFLKFSKEQTRDTGSSRVKIRFESRGAQEPFSFEKEFPIVGPFN